MGDELKVVNPPEIMAYGKRLNTNIDSITTEANGLIADVTNVDYHGTNAFKLKTDANHMTEQFAKDMFQRDLDAEQQRVEGDVEHLRFARRPRRSRSTSATTRSRCSTCRPDTGVQIADPSALTLARLDGAGALRADPDRHQRHQAAAREQPHRLDGGGPQHVRADRRPVRVRTPSRRRTTPSSSSSTT